MKILAIDTSCDETSVAVTEGVRVLSNVISSQVRYHKKYGGVVPMLAGRLHTERIDHVIAEALLRAKMQESDIDAIAVTYGPGLAPALQVGIATAKTLAERLALPLYAINHMVGHISSCFAQVGTMRAEVPLYPQMVMLASGSHTELVYLESFTNRTIIGQTLDDALGEAYDKVGRMLGLGYPGGKVVATLAKMGNDQAYPLPVPMQRSNDLNFSYSGLKNAVRLLIEEEKPLTREKIHNISASFERVAQKAVLDKVEKAYSRHPTTRQLVLAGGVAANTRLRRSLRSLAHEFDCSFVVPRNLRLCTDNAAMIGIAAFLGIQNGQLPSTSQILERIPYLSIETHIDTE